MITSNIKNYDRYLFNDKFKTAFEFLTKEDLATLPMGKTVITDDVFILKQNYTTNALGESFWESHIDYIDIQYVVNGAEKFAYAPVSTLTEIMHYKENDMKVFKGKVDSICLLNAGDFAIFFPEDGHMPALNPGNESSVVDKYLVKIRV